MRTILTRPFRRALIVEHPNPSLDDHLHDLRIEALL